MGMESVLVRFYSGKKCKREMEIHCDSMIDALLVKLAFTVLFGVPIAENKVSVMVADKLEAL